MPEQTARPAQTKLSHRKRIQPRVDEKTVRLAKSKAALQGLHLEYVIERLLAGWVAGKFNIVEQKENHT